MFAQPVVQHQWLDRLVGNWTSEMTCPMGPDQPPMIHKGKETVRSLGGLWVICEGEAEMPEGGISRSIMTLGYDPQQSCFVGTFIASVMTHLWTYQGMLSEGDSKLVLDTIGPDFSSESGEMVQYKDTIILVDEDHRILTSSCLTKEGVWQQFMEGHYYRVK